MLVFYFGLVAELLAVIYALFLTRWAHVPVSTSARNGSREVVSGHRLQARKSSVAAMTRSTSGLDLGKMAARRPSRFNP